MDADVALIDLYSSYGSSAITDLNIYLTSTSYTTGSSNNDITNDQTLTIIGPLTYSFVGMPVAKVGRTSGWTTGQVTNTCYNTTVGGFNHPDGAQNTYMVCQINTDVPAIGGDSGAPLFRTSSSGNNRFMGIQSFAPGANGPGGFSPWSAIKSDLGNDIYVGSQI